MLADPRVAVADPESGEWPGQRGDQGARMASTVAADPTLPPPCPVAPRPPAQITTRTTGTAHAARSRPGGAHRRTAAEPCAGGISLAGSAVRTGTAHHFDGSEPGTGVLR